jgi:hypothetical protein
VEGWRRDGEMDGWMDGFVDEFVDGQMGIDGLVAG